MSCLCNFLVSLVLSLFIIRCFTGQCTHEMCEKISLNLTNDAKHNLALHGHVLEILSVSTWEGCFFACLENCQCLSFNFYESSNKTANCELNEASTKIVPAKALKASVGVTYYEPVRKYPGRKGNPHKPCAEQVCYNYCCESATCQHKGTCHEVCDVNKKRFHCICAPKYTGHRCQIELSPRSCRDVMLFENQRTNGIYYIVDDQNTPFPVFCDFGSEPWASWTLIQSHSLQNNDAFKHIPFYLNDRPINQATPEWNSYRLSMSRMKSVRNVSTHWRATCNFPTHGVDFRDYIRSSFAENDLLAVPGGDRCAWYEHVDIRGNRCINCTAFSPYSASHAYHIDSWYGKGLGCTCDFDGKPLHGIYNEDNFGFYSTVNSLFRCSSRMASTTQYWFGGH